MVAARGLIIDVGAHNGDDAAYYLHKGYHVVAVEANPVLAEQLRIRFDGHPVTVENVCVASDTLASVTFWVNRVNSTWSSFYPDLAAREETETESVNVPSITLGVLLERYGIPEYLKIDIEGMDQECLKSLDPANLPSYISLELSHGDGIISGLGNVGYNRFKVINQGTYTTALPIFSQEIGWRLIRKARMGFLVPDGFKQDFDTFHHQHGWTFNEGCSGPFGAETFGTWLTEPEAKALYDKIRRAFIRHGMPLEHCWYDVHATQV